jgi:hypothetical protein
MAVGPLFIEVSDTEVDLGVWVTTDKSDWIAVGCIAEFASSFWLFSTVRSGSLGVTRSLSLPAIDVPPTGVGVLKLANSIPVISVGRRPVNPVKTQNTATKDSSAPTKITDFPQLIARSRLLSERFPRLGGKFDRVAGSFAAMLFFDTLAALVLAEPCIARVSALANPLAEG